MSQRVRGRLWYGSAHRFRELPFVGRVTRQALGPMSDEERAPRYASFSPKMTPLRDLVQRALGLDGHEVVVTQDGSEALGTARRTGAGAIVDLGRADARSRRHALVEASLKIAPQLRVLLMSDSPTSSAAPASAQQNFPVIGKPFTLEQIRTTPGSKWRCAERGPRCST